MYLSFEQYLCGSADFLICCNLRMRPHITQYTSHSTQHTAHSTQYSRAISQAASRCASFGELPLRRHEDNSEVDDLQPFRCKNISRTYPCQAYRGPGIIAGRFCSNIQGVFLTGNPLKS